MAYIGRQPTAAALTASDITDGVVSNAKLAQDIISADTELAVAPASTDEFLVSDAGVLKRIDASLVGKGKVLQCVSTTVTSQASSNSTSYVAATGMSVSITPSATSSKVLVTFDNAGRCDNSAAASILTLYRDATNIGNGDNGMCHIKNDDDIRASSSGAILDSPSSTSAITYAVYHRVTDANGNSYIAYDGASSTITAIEIGA